MTEITVENLFNQIAQLPPPEQSRLWRMIEPLAKAVPVENGKPSTVVENGTPPKKKIEPIPLPDRTREMQWLKEHARKFIGQWVALDGDRLIAHGPDAKAVYAAARADGAYLPMVDSIEDPDLPFVF
ncbi:MAG: hypothetical protein HOP19_11370 [Acidobacteria bacterium]|nr:hypothetical protein [Acidobacteriota bacterium]